MMVRWSNILVIIKNTKTLLYYFSSEHHRSQNKKYINCTLKHSIMV